MTNTTKLFCICILLAANAAAQNWTTVTASNITDLNQNKLAAGQLCFLVTDQNDNPVSVNIGGGGQNLKRPYCSTVTAGSAAAFTVPNPAATSPSGIYYRVTVKDTSTGLEVLRYTQVAFSGGSFNFDNYAPANLGSFNPLTGNSVTGNLSVSGNESVTGASTAASYSTTGGSTAGSYSTAGPSSAASFSASGTDIAGAYNISTRGDRQIILQNPDFEGSTLIPPPGWGAAPSGSIAYETTNPAPGKTQSLKYASAVQFAPVKNINLFSVVPGETYSISCAMKSDGNGIPVCFIQFFSSSFSATGNVAAFGTTSTSWSTLTATGTVPANSISAQIQLQNNSATEPSAVWFDQVSVQKTSFKSITEGRVLVGGAPLTSASVTGAGSTAIVAIGSNSTDSFGELLIEAAGTGAASSGTITLNFSSALGSNGAVAILVAMSSDSAWNPRASFQQTNLSTALAVLNWDNNGVPLVAGNNYRVAYYVFGR